MLNSPRFLCAIIMPRSGAPAKCGEEVLCRNFAVIWLAKCRLHNIPGRDSLIFP